MTFDLFIRVLVAVELVVMTFLFLKEYRRRFKAEFRENMFSLQLDITRRECERYETREQEYIAEIREKEARVTELESALIDANESAKICMDSLGFDENTKNEIIGKNVAVLDVSQESKGAGVASDFEGYVDFIKEP